MSSTEIKPFVGYADLVLGQTRDQVAELLGKPDDMWDLEGKGECFVWEYDNYSLMFDDEHDMRLSGITVADINAEVFGLAVFNQPLDSVAQHLKLKGIEFEIIEDEEEANLCDLDMEDHGISLHFQDKLCINIEIYPEYLDDGETVVWPTNS